MRLIYIFITLAIFSVSPFLKYQLSSCSKLVLSQIFQPSIMGVCSTQYQPLDCLLGILCKNPSVMHSVFCFLHSSIIWMEIKCYKL